MMLSLPLLAVMNTASWIVLAVIAIIVILVIVHLVRNKKKGKGSCSCGGSCSGCPSAGLCHGGEDKNA